MATNHTIMKCKLQCKLASFGKCFIHHSSTRETDACEIKTPMITYQPNLPFYYSLIHDFSRTNLRYRVPERKAAKRQITCLANDRKDKKDRTQNKTFHKLQSASTKDEHAPLHPHTMTYRPNCSQENTLQRHFQGSKEMLTRMLTGHHLRQ